MELIKTLDDARLSATLEGIEYDYHALLRDSLRAALEERDVFKANVDTLVESCDNVMKQRNDLIVETAAQKAVINGLHELVDRYIDDRDAALDQLCRAREAFIEIVNNCGCADDADFCMNCVRANDAISALSSSAPCPHEAEAKRLEETLVNLMKSSDASWFSGKHGGHDWREAVDAAHLVLVKYGRRALKGEE